MADIEAVVSLYRRVRRKEDANEIRKLYETLLSGDSMPCFEDVAVNVDENYMFRLLYLDMWYRHRFARSSSSPTLLQMIDYWSNYYQLHQVLLWANVYLSKLPNKWFWDILDGFVNRFQSFCQYRALESKTEQEIVLLRRCSQVWAVSSVIKRLQELRDNSSIIQILKQAKDGGLQLLTAARDDDEDGGSNVLEVVGYFSMVCLLRVHCLLGNYQTGLDCLLPIDITQQGFYTSLIATHITTIYHYGFANLMLGRCVEAIRVFNDILVHIFKTKQPQQKEEKIEQMYALLAICLSLCPSQLQLIDENVHSQLMEKYGERMSRMPSYDDIEELLSYAWPAFSAPFAPNSGDPREFMSQEELAEIGDELLLVAYPDIFGPSASSYAVNLKELKAVVEGMLTLKAE